MLNNKIIINNDIQNYFSAILGLLLTGTWLEYKLGVIKFFVDLIKVKDEKEILLPSLLFLISLFVFTYFAGVIRYDNASEFLKPLLPLITFILGQYITRFDR